MSPANRSQMETYRRRLVADDFAWTEDYGDDDCVKSHLQLAPERKSDDWC